MRWRSSSACCSATCSGPRRLRGEGPPDRMGGHGHGAHLGGRLRHAVDLRQARIFRGPEHGAAPRISVRARRAWHVGAGLRGGAEPASPDPPPGAEPHCPRRCALHRTGAHLLHRPSHATGLALRADRLHLSEPGRDRGLAVPSTRGLDMAWRSPFGELRGRGDACWRGSAPLQLRPDLRLSGAAHVHDVHSSRRARDAHRSSRRRERRDDVRYSGRVVHSGRDRRPPRTAQNG